MNIFGNYQRLTILIMCMYNCLSKWNIHQCIAVWGNFTASLGSYPQFLLQMAFPARLDVASLMETADPPHGHDAKVHATSEHAHKKDETEDEQRHVEATYEVCDEVRSAQSAGW